MYVNSKKYWENRYKTGGNSGNGSYGLLSKFKADVINNFLHKEKILNVCEFGCGDGNQLSLLNINEYTGYDVSQTIIDKCNNLYNGDTTKKFIHINNYEHNMYDATFSLDVIFHLVEDSIFEEYMNNLFNSSKKFVIIYSSNYENKGHNHVRHRKFTDYISSKFKDFELIKEIDNKYPNDSFANFYIYKKK